MSSNFDDINTALAVEVDRACTALVSGETLRSLLETSGQIDRIYWQHCIDQGWTAIGIPEEFGGIGLGLEQICLLIQRGGQQAVGVSLLETGFVTAQALVLSQNSGLNALWLPAIASGEVSALTSIVEGSELLPTAPQLRLDNGRLTGTRTAVPAGAIADIGVFSVSADGGPKLALVDLRAGGVTRTPVPSFDNSRCPADLSFEGAKAWLIDVPDPLAAMAELLDLQAVIAAFAQIGGADAMLNLARSHAMQRRAFGQPIAAFQSVKHKIAEGYVQIEIARANAEAALAARGTPAFSRAAMAARVTASEAYESVTRDAVQVHGGIGVTWEADLHLHQRRARSLALELGPILAWDDRLADTLCKDAA